MAWQFTVYSIPPLVATLVSSLLVAVAWRHRDRSIAIPFGTLTLALAVWSLTYAIQLGYTTLGGQLFWWRVGIAVGATIPSLWLVLTLYYAGREEWFTARTAALLAIDPIVFAVLAWTNVRGWVVRDASLGADPTIAELTLGPGYLIHIAYAYLLVLAGIALLLGVFVRTSRLYRKQAGTLIAGAVVPLSANVGFTLGASPVPGLDLTTFAFAVTGVFFALALFRFELLDLAPMARRQMIDELGDGIVVLDANRRVVEYNDNAKRILDRSIEVRQPASTIFPDESLDELDGSVLERTDGARRFYQVRSTPLRDYREELAGYLVALREITDRKEYEQRLEVANRLLRHNLRNEVNLILGHATNLEGNLEGQDGVHVGAIRETAERMIDRSEKVRRMETTLDSGAEPVSIDAVGVVRRVVDRFVDAYQDADVSLEAPPNATTSIIDAGLLDAAVANLIENAIEHNPDASTVRVSVERGEAVSVSVADDGPGIPAVEREVIAEGRETALRHSSGVGLWLVHWIVSASGGTVHFEENAPRGSVVRIELPVA